MNPQLSNCLFGKFSFQLLLKLPSHHWSQGRCLNISLLHQPFYFLPCTISFPPTCRWTATSRILKSSAFLNPSPSLAATYPISLFLYRQNASGMSTLSKIMPRLLIVLRTRSNLFVLRIKSRLLTCAHKVQCDLLMLSDLVGTPHTVCFAHSIPTTPNSLPCLEHTICLHIEPLHLLFPLLFPNMLQVAELITSPGLSSVVIF